KGDVGRAEVAETTRRPSRGGAGHGREGAQPRRAQPSASLRAVWVAVGDAGGFPGRLPRVRSSQQSGQETEPSENGMAENGMAENGMAETEAAEKRCRGGRGSPKAAR